LGVGQMFAGQNLDRDTSVVRFSGECPIIGDSKKIEAWIKGIEIAKVTFDRARQLHMNQTMEYRPLKAEGGQVDIQLSRRANNTIAQNQLSEFFLKSIASLV